METALSQIIPDFVVEAVNGELILSMNNRGIPDMRINREYAEMFQDYAGNKANQTTQMKEAVQFVKQKTRFRPMVHRCHQAASRDFAAYDGNNHPFAARLLPHR